MARSFVAFSCGLPPTLVYFFKERGKNAFLIELNMYVCEEKKSLTIMFSSICCKYKNTYACETLTKNTPFIILEYIIQNKNIIHISPVIQLSSI